MQLPVPLQAPPQPAKVEFTPGEAVRVTLVPSSKTAAQLVPQSMSSLPLPGGSPVIVPVPVPCLVTVRVKVPAGGGSPLGIQPFCTVAVILPLASIVELPTAAQLIAVVPSLRLKVTPQAVPAAVPASRIAARADFQFAAILFIDVFSPTGRPVTSRGQTAACYAGELSDNRARGGTLEGDPAHREINSKAQIADRWWMVPPPAPRRPSCQGLLRCVYLNGPSRGG